MGNFFTRTAKRTRAVAFALLFVFSSILTLHITSGTALAAGETYTFKDANTIIAKGGDFPEEITMTLKDGKYTGTYNQIISHGSVSRSWSISGVAKAAPKQGYTGTISTSGQNTAGKNIKGNIVISDPSNVGPGGGNGAAPTATASDSGGDGKTEKALDCGSGPLNWIVCPGIMLASYAAQTLDSFIINTLNIDVQQIFDETKTKGTPSYGYYTAWSSFRVIATGLLVVGGLFMVASQALGFEFLDAYTIRKTLPRLFVAIIGISLSWPLMRYVVQFFDVLGVDIRELIYAPFKDFSNSISVGGGILTTIGIGAGILVLGPASLTILITILISVFVGFLALVIRQIAIIALIIIAPIAIACYILPNTQKMWKLWHENFLGLLAAFPLISAVIAAGKVFAAVALNTNTKTTGVISAHASALVGHVTGHSFLQHMAADAANNIGSLTAQGVALFAAYAPYLLIGTIIQRTTGAISTLAGGAGGFLQGMNKRLQGVRSNAAAKNLHDMKTGNRFKGDSWAADKFNHLSENIAAIPKAGYNPRNMRRNMRASKSQHAMAEAAEYGEKNQAFNVIKGNDDFLMAAMEGKGNEDKTRAALQRVTDGNGNRVYNDRDVEDGVAAIRAARRDVNSEVFEKAAVMALPATGTAFKAKFDDQGNVIGGGAGEMHQMINEVAGDDRVTAARMLVAMRGGAAQARRFDLAGGSFAKQAGVMQQQYNEEKNNGATYVNDAGDSVKAYMSSNEGTEAILEQSLDGQGGGYVAASKTSAVRAFAPAMKKKLEKAIASGDDRAALREFAAIAGRYDAMSNVSPENAQAMQEGVMSQIVTYKNEPKPVWQHVDELTNSGEKPIADLRKDFARMSRDNDSALNDAEARRNQAAIDAGSRPSGLPGS